MVFPHLLHLLIQSGKLNFKRISWVYIDFLCVSLFRSDSMLQGDHLEDVF